MKSFNYKKSVKIIRWGCDFDSLLELKFAISIRDEFESLRSHISIWYDPRTKMPTNYIRDNIRRYTPDFLIRHKQTGEALLVEVKPRAFEGQEQLAIRKEVAENYIRWKNYDWKFKVVYSDEIRLSVSQQQELEQYKKWIPSTERKRNFQEWNDKFDRSKPRLFTSVPSNRVIRYVMFGNCKVFSG